MIEDDYGDLLEILQARSADKDELVKKYENKIAKIEEKHRASCLGSFSRWTGIEVGSTIALDDKQKNLGMVTRIEFGHSGLPHIYYRELTKAGKPKGKEWKLDSAPELVFG